MWRRVVLSVVGRIHGGRIEIHENGTTTVIGDEGSDLRATVTVHSPKLWRRMLRGSTGMGDSYMRHEWDCDDLVTLWEIAGRNLPRLDRLRRRFAFITGPFQRLGVLMPRSTRSRASSAPSRRRLVGCWMSAAVAGNSRCSCVNSS